MAYCPCVLVVKGAEGMLARFVFIELVLLISSSAFAQEVNCVDVILAFDKPKVGPYPYEKSVIKARDDWLNEQLGVESDDFEELDYREKLKSVEILILRKLDTNPDLYNDLKFLSVAINELATYYSLFGDYDNLPKILGNIDKNNAYALFSEPAFRSRSSASLLVGSGGDGLFDIYSNNLPHDIYNLDFLSEFYPEKNGADYRSFLDCANKISNEVQ
ncbi:hypothetical protein L4D15_01270 [Enterovibrio norvegicus]|uniref:hypothetical protein n=1 Tax=Enterovibrio norvegicus TaxID=188144 RepID=UPI003D145F79